MPCFLQKQIPTKPTNKETRARGASRISAHSDAHLTNHNVWKYLFGFWIESSCSKSMTFLRQLRILAGEFLMWGLWRAVTRTFWFDVFLLRRSQITQAGLKVTKQLRITLNSWPFCLHFPRAEMADRYHQAQLHSRSVLKFQWVLVFPWHRTKCL